MCLFIYFARGVCVCVCVGSGPSFLACRQHHSALSAPSIKTKQLSEHSLGPLSKATYLSLEL